MTTFPDDCPTSPFFFLSPKQRHHTGFDPCERSFDPAGLEDPPDRSFHL